MCMFDFVCVAVLMKMVDAVSLCDVYHTQLKCRGFLHLHIVAVTAYFVCFAGTREKES
jgi:hypothetical protein